MEFHEFYLEDYEARGVTENNKVCRIAMGELVNAEAREVFRPGWGAPDLDTKTGSIGFLDLLRRKEWVPKEYPKENLNEGRDFEIREVPIILTIGIEPKHRKSPLYALSLIKKAEETARRWEFNEIVAHTIDKKNGDRLLNALSTLGYFIYHDNMAIKKLVNST